MQKSSRRLARRSLDKAPQTGAVPQPEITDPVDAILGGFEARDTGVVIVPSAPAEKSGPDAAATVPATIDPTITTSHDAPAMTRRELREREARAAARPVLFTSTGSQGTPAAGSALSSPRRARVSSGDRDSVTSRKRAKAPGSGVSRRASAGTARTRSVRLARSAHPAGRPRVAAAVVPAQKQGSATKTGVKRRILSQFLSLSAMAGVGLILVATTVPANAFTRPEALTASTEVMQATETQAAQELEVESVAAAPTVTRDSYTAVSQQQQVAARYGNRLMLYTNNPNGTIQWPFVTGVPITSGFGGRQVAGCGFCSTNHLGLDFTPGAGTPIQSIMDGTVSKVEVSNGGFGNHVVIDHVVDGQKVQSLYAHMQYGSVEVAVGQQVKVGDIVGGVGSTGASTGAHLHLEVHLDGTPVDPFAWLQANAN